MKMLVLLVRDHPVSETVCDQNPGLRPADSAQSCVDTGFAAVGTGLLSTRIPLAQLTRFAMESAVEKVLLSRFSEAR